jgi:signal transduction histidine kinase
VPEELRSLVDAVDAAYDQSDVDRAMLERSLELSSHELLQANAELRSVFQALPDLFFRLNRDGRILDRRGGDRDDPYIGAKSLRGRRIQDVPLPEVARAFHDGLRRVSDGEALVTVEYAISGGDNVRYYEARLVPLMKDQVVAVVRNVTERKAAERALAAQADELARSNAELEQFAYVASHDMREPLRTVQSYLELLRRRYQGQLDSDADEFIDFAVDGARRMKRLIDDLLSYARVASRGRPFGAVDLEEVFDEVLSALATAISERDAKVEAGELPTVQADQGQLRQLLQNLIANGLKFCEGRPQIHLDVDRRDGDWLLCVRDNGIGMDPEQALKIFDIFKRLHSRDQYQGTGIGLAICKKIVERHGGRLWVESELGKGASFYFTLPFEPGLASLPPGGPS